MSQKNETLILVLASIIPIGLVLGGLWFMFVRKSSIPIQTTNSLKKIWKLNKKVLVSKKSP
ncbi:hypothetical protein H6G36_13240 [Anabaena minutissima FACHB-250]|nr:hypothetical protein [Anabaena minutissima FACHB-250]